MQALFTTGDPTEPLQWRQTTTPTLIDATDALVRPLAVAACDLDRQIVARKSPFPGEFIIGHEFTAEVEAVGDAVTTLAEGDVVLASFQPSCGACARCDRSHSSVCDSVANGAMYGIGDTGGNWGGALASTVRIPWAETNLARLTADLDPVALASASDNLADGLRGIDGPLARNPGASVLVAGRGSIALYATLCAQHLGAGAVTVASRDPFVLKTATALGVDCLSVERWPQRFASHDITVDCTNSIAGLSAVLKSTAPYGECTSSSIFFQSPTPIPMFNLNMRGITFHTGRVNSAASLHRVLELVRQGLQPERIDPAYWPMEEAISALRTEPYSRKIILHR